MSFDIYGNNLRPGHCEVHPHVNQPWPCDLCIANNDQRAAEEAAYNAALEAKYNEWCQEQESLTTDAEGE